MSFGVQGTFTMPGPCAENFSYPNIPLLLYSVAVVFSVYFSTPK